MVCFGLLFVMWCGPQAGQPSTSISDFCQIARPIRMSHSDTRGTKEQVARENLKIKRICGNV